MISGYVDTAGKYTGAEEQKTQLQQYAASCGLPLERIICGQGWEEDKLSLVKRGDSLLVADVSVFGRRYEDILNNVRQAAMRGLRLYTVRERLHLDLLLPQPFADSADICLQLYKGILSIRNKDVQDGLLRHGKKRGRPFNGINKSSVLDGREGQIAAALAAGVKKKELAEELGCGRTTLCLFIKAKKLDVRQDGMPGSRFADGAATGETAGGRAEHG